MTAHPDDTSSLPATLRLAGNPTLHLCLASALIFINLFATARFLGLMHAAIALQTDAPVTLPPAKPAKQEPDPNTPAIKLLADGTTLENGVPISIEDLLAHMRAQAPARVRVIAGHDVHYDRLKALLVQLSDCGVGQITFVAEPNDPTSGGR